MRILLVISLSIIYINSFAQKIVYKDIVNTYWNSSNDSNLIIASFEFKNEHDCIKGIDTFDGQFHTTMQAFQYALDTTGKITLLKLIRNDSIAYIYLIKWSHRPESVKLQNVTNAEIKKWNKKETDQNTAVYTQLTMKIAEDPLDASEKKP